MEAARMTSQLIILGLILYIAFAAWGMESKK